MSSTAQPAAIVVGVDGSPSSDLALDWAIDEASRRKLALHLIHAHGLGYTASASLISVPPDWEETEQPLFRARARVASLAPEVPVTLESSAFSPSRSLVQASRHADTVVVGARGRGVLAGALLGSTSQQLAMHASCPVVVVRELGTARPALPRVIVGVDGSALSSDAVGCAFAYASARGLGLTAVHGWSADLVERSTVPTTPSSEWSRIADEELALVSETLAGWSGKFPDVDVRRHVMRKHAVQAMVSESDGAELVVVGSRGHGGFTGLLLGSVSQGVLLHAHCPVAVVRPRPASGDD